MIEYTFYGEILPKDNIKHLAVSVNRIRPDHGLAIVNILIVEEQIEVRVKVKQPWPVLDLRNLVIELVDAETSLVSFACGYGFSIFVSRVTSEELKLNNVFVSKVGVAAEVIPEKEKSSMIKKARILYERNGEYFARRAMKDLRLALVQHDDSPFFCYRAAEALMKHCNLVTGSKPKPHEEWDRFRKICKTSKEDILFIKKGYADQIRHGTPVSFSDSQRTKCIRITWRMTARYVENIKRYLEE